MKKTIQLTESDIKKIVMEAVSELKYDTYKSTYDKMQDNNQPQRAADFNDSFKARYNDDDTRFSLANDTISIGEPNARTRFFRDGSMFGVDSNNAYDRSNFPRTSNRKLARNRANKLNFFNGSCDNAEGNYNGGVNTGTFSKNDFISEAIDRVFEKMFR